MLFKLLTVASVVLCLATLPTLADPAEDNPTDQATVQSTVEPAAEVIQTPTDAEAEPALDLPPFPPDTDSPTAEESEPVVDLPPLPFDTDAEPEETTELVIKLGIPESKPASGKARKVAAKGNTAGGYTSAQLDRAARIARDALSYRGAPYVWGGDGRNGVFDCSGFTHYLYARKGIKLPHSAKLQFKMGKAVNGDDLRDGDLVFFNTRGPISHVGMYIGDGKFIHAANPRRGVVTSRMNNSYYSKRYAGARRY